MSPERWFLNPQARAEAENKGRMVAERYRLLGLKQAIIPEITHLSQGYLSQIENGEVLNLGYLTQIRLAQALGLGYQFWSGVESQNVFPVPQIALLRKILESPNLSPNTKPKIEELLRQFIFENKQVEHPNLYYLEFFPPQQPIGKKIRDLRLAAGSSQKDLADAAQIEQSTLSEIENKESKKVLLSALEKIAQALNCSFESLLGIRELALAPTILVEGDHFFRSQMVEPIIKLAGWETISDYLIQKIPDLATRRAVFRKNVVSLAS